MTQIDANAVIEAYQERLKLITHELLLAQAYIAAQSTQISEYRDAVSEKDARIIGLENELGDAHDRLNDEAEDDGLVPIVAVRKRNERALYAATHFANGISTVIEMILTGGYDGYTDENFERTYKEWAENEKATWKTVHVLDTVEYRNGQPVTVLAEGVREEDAAVRVGRVPGEPR